MIFHSTDCKAPGFGESGLHLFDRKIYSVNKSAINLTRTSRKLKAKSLKLKAKAKAKVFTADEADETDKKRKEEYTDTRLLTLYNTTCYSIFCQK